jgi:hypothetical protein
MKSRVAPATFTSRPSRRMNLDNAGVRAPSRSPVPRSADALASWKTGALLPQEDDRCRTIPREANYPMADGLADLQCHKSLHCQLIPADRAQRPIPSWRRCCRSARWLLWPTWLPGSRYRCCRFTWARAPSWSGSSSARSSLRPWRRAAAWPWGPMPLFSTWRWDWLRRGWSGRRVPGQYAGRAVRRRDRRALPMERNSKIIPSLFRPCAPGTVSFLTGFVELTTWQVGGALSRRNKRRGKTNAKTQTWEQQS